MKNKILNIIVNFFIVFTVTILIIISYSKFIKKNRITSLFGKSILVVRTGSMEPTINSGDMIIISKDYSYKKGDIVTFYDEGSLITHRIVKQYDDKYITKGDANDIEDGEVLPTNIQGRMIYKSHLFGFIILYLLKPFVFLYFMTIVVIYVIKTYLNNENTKEDESIDKKQDEQTKEINE